VHYRVLIENRDSTPLAVTGVELTGPLYELTFLAAANRKMTLEYGSPDAQAGRYDTAALQAALSQGQAVTQAKWQPPRENLHAPTDQGRSWQPWNHPRVLFGGHFPFPPPWIPPRPRSGSPTRRSIATCSSPRTTAAL